MTRKILGENAKAEIREAIKACRTRKERAAAVAALADHYHVGKDRIYAVTKGIRAKQKTRADKGTRKVDIKSDPALRLIVGGILEYGESTAESIANARLRGVDVPVEFTTLNRYMREVGLTKKTRRTPAVPHRRFEASAPGEMFQFDISGVKERWYDSHTRRIVNVSSLEVSKNHENEKSGRTRVWRFALVDDYSRRCFIRYVGVAKPSSSHVVDFLLQAYSEMGVPLRLYTDNDKIIKFGRNARTTEILNKVLITQGGYENIFHLPGNSRATGKVERLHQTVEQCEKFLGRYISERGGLSLEEMNTAFAPRVMHTLNVERVHSETGQTPMARWEGKLSTVRTLEYQDLRSAFMADEFEVKLRGDLTFRLKGATFQLPTSEMYPFANWIGQKLRVVFPDDQQFFTVVGLDGVEYDVVKENEKPDTAGDFRSTRETDANRLRRELKAEAKERARSLRSQISDLKLPEPIRFFDDDAAASDISHLTSNISKFPKPETPIDIAAVDREAPGRVAATHNPAINFWEAVSRFGSQFASKAECKQFFDTLYPSRDEEHWLLLSEIETALQNRRDTGTNHGLRAVS